MRRLELTLDVPPEDDGGHAPGPEENWQESSCVTWYSPRDGVGGHFHTGLQRNRGRADYWTHVVVDQAIVAQEHAIAAPMPQGNYPDLTLGPLRVSGKEPLRAYRVVATYDDVECDVSYQAFPGAVIGFRMEGRSVAIARGHFESHGVVEGTVRVGERTVDVRGFGFHDRSWGPRDYRNILAVRNLMANFGPDLHLQTFDCTTPAGRDVFGYVVADGELQPVTSISGRTEIGDDGWTPLGCDLVFWTENGRGYHLRGISECTTYNVGWDDTLRGVGYLRCELGGRVGGGQIWVGEMGRPAPWQLATLRTEWDDVGP